VSQQFIGARRRPAMQTEVLTAPRIQKDEK
jgi:hypothetical protein